MYENIKKHFFKFGVLLLLVSTLTGFANLFNKISSEKDYPIAGYDAFGYFMYLPHLVQKGNLNMHQEWLNEVQLKRYNFEAYQLSKRENGNSINIYHMGLSFVQAPAFFIAHFYCKISGSQADGLSKPYAYALLINALLFVYLGLLYLFKFLRLFFEKNLSLGLVLLTFFGTNLMLTSYVSHMMQHLYLFALISVFCYHFFKSVQEPQLNKKHFFYALLVFGLCTVIRPTNVLLFFIPIVYLWKYFETKKSYLFYLSLFPFSSFLWNIPHFLYWKIIGGSWLLTNLHSEEVIIIDPNTIDFLFSFRKGWFVYTPLFLALIPGLYLTFKKSKKLFWTISLTLIMCIWVFSSWECWHYASSFGSRVMIDLYPICIVPIGFLIQKIHTQKVYSRIVFYSFISGIVLLNCFQSYQFTKGIISDQVMTQAYYWKVFGALEQDEKAKPYLEINRSNTNWPLIYTLNKYPGLQLQKKRLLNLSYQQQPTDSKIQTLCLLDHLSTDETQLEVSYSYYVLDSTVSILARCEVESKFNTYNWNSLELTFGKEKNQLLMGKILFNLPEIRHRKDSLMMYLDNLDKSIIQLKSIQINAVSLIRK